MRAELLAKDVQGGAHIFWPFVDDVVIGVGLHQTSRRCTDRGPHICDEESTVWFGTNLIDDGTQNATVGLLEFRSIRVANVKVESSILITLQPCKHSPELVETYLSLQERQETSSNKRLPISRWPQMMR